MYRSDGIISYTKSEVESDKKLANYLGIPLVRIVVISKDKLLDNNTLFSYEAKGDSIFVNQANTADFPTPASPTKRQICPSF